MSASFSHFYNPKYQRKNGELYPNLDVTSQSQQNIWLVKVPKFISEQWKNTIDGGVLGKLTIQEKSSKQSDHPPTPPIEISLQLSDLPETQLIPKQFHLNILDSNVTNTFVFSDTKKGYADCIQGQIHTRGFMVPKINPEYHLMNKKRTQLAAIQKKQTKIIKKEELAKNLGLGFAVFSQDSIFAQKYLKQKSQDTRKERIPQTQLIQRMIHLFREYPYWSLKGLTERTFQSQVYVKEVLSSVARLNKRGPYAGMYSLLPELKSSDSTSEIFPNTSETSTVPMEVNDLSTVSAPSEASSSPMDVDPSL
ncbi:hypothetical protein HMI56_006871 [Coelomomyces lativittatus]|nr:hypothetical protein HMI56_006871 [Coelomomyces lativittatus]